MKDTPQRAFIALSAILLIFIALLFIFRPKEVLEADTLSDTLTEQEDSLLSRHERAVAERHQQYRQQYRQQSHTPSQRPQHWTDYPRDTLVMANAYQPAEPLMFDLNLADSIDLVQLWGIGPTFARRITSYRQRLGGFHSKLQLMEVKGMTDTLYNAISPYLTLDHPTVRRLNINTAPLDSLKRHPYLGYHRARAIINYRNAAGPFCKIEDLLKVNLIEPETYQRLLPYIEL